VCVCVCVCVCSRGYLRNHTRDLFQTFVLVAYGGGSVLLRLGDEIPRGRGGFEVFFPIDNALYSTAFGTHAKTVESIEMPFGMMSELGPRNSVLRGLTIPEGKGAFLGKKHVPDKPNTPDNCKLDWSMPGYTTGQTLYCKRWTSPLSSAK